jgi:helix-turn-helix protein
MTTAIKLNKFQIYTLLKDYHWMIKEIKRIQTLLDETDFKGTSQYGVEATLPKAQGNNSDPLFIEIHRRDKKYKRLNEYIQKIKFIEERLERITDEKEKVVLDCLLDGMSMVSIANHLGITRKHAHDIRDRIVDKLAE